MDVHVPRAITVALQLRFVDVLTAQEDGTTELDDELLPGRATQLQRVLASQDADLLKLGEKWLNQGASPGSFTHINSGLRSVN